jgi:hypothetical protein
VSMRSRHHINVPETRKQFECDDHMFLAELETLYSSGECENPAGAENYRHTLEKFDALRTWFWQMDALGKSVDRTETGCLESIEKLIESIEQKLLVGEKTASVVAQNLEIGNSLYQDGRECFMQLYAVELDRSAHSVEPGLYPMVIRQHLIFPLVPMETGGGFRGLVLGPSWIHRHSAATVASLRDWCGIVDIQALSGVEVEDTPEDLLRAALRLWRPEDEYGTYYRYETALDAVRRIWGPKTDENSCAKTVLYGGAGIS